MLDQRCAHTRAVDHVEYTGGHCGAFGSAHYGQGHLLSSCHMPAVGLEYHRATCGQCRSGVATRRGERQREVAGAKHGHRAYADAALAQVCARQGLTVRQRLIDARAIKVAPAQYVGEQAHLPAGASALALDTGGRQGGFTTDDGDKVVTQGVDFIGDGFQKFGPACGRQAAKGREGAIGGTDRRIDFGLGGLDKGVRQCFAGAGVHAVQMNTASAAALAADEILAGDGGHMDFLRVDVAAAEGTRLRPRWCATATKHS